MPWFVLYTKSRSEKSVAEKLRAMNVEVYCPLIKTQRQWSDRVKVVEEPLFQSYCFVHLKEQQRSVVFGVPGLVRYLFWQGMPAIVRDSEIDSIKTMLNEVDHQRICTRPLKPGTFRNSGGTLMRQDRNGVSVMLESMQMALEVDPGTTSLTR